ncbi:unnamed protein product [Arctia plantaginis]|uniref:Uncharacterized protein n=1 Tax=Arctia plantaginis TaxID=874455 RepID=A0A8S0ZY41_ARCPL|nr:unnamed protein product [Arctia plantaginis]CAB3237587.1 unnamed protein product [Arctia plantaginis]
MNRKNRIIQSKAQLEAIVENLSDLSDIDSDDDAYYQTAAVNGPADDLNFTEDTIIESCLEEMLGASHILEENIECTELYSENSLRNVLKENSTISRVSERSEQQIEGSPTQIINEHIETQEEWREIVNLTDREIEIEQCFDEIFHESSYDYPIQKDDTSAGPSNHNVTEIVNQASEHHSRQRRAINVSRPRQPREWKIEKEIHYIWEFINTIKPKSAYNLKTRLIDVFKKSFPEYLV